MTLTSKTIQVGTMKVNATVTKEQINDLLYYDRIYEYKYDDINEIKIVSRYFDFDYFMNGYIYYHTNKITMRKIKLLIIEGNEISETLRKIIKNSKIIDASDMLENKLSNELAASIDKKILMKLIGLGKSI